MDNISNLQCNNIYSCMRAVINNTQNTYCINDNSCFHATFIGHSTNSIGKYKYKYVKLPNNTYDNNININIHNNNTVSCNGQSSCQHATFINTTKI